MQNLIQQFINEGRKVTTSKHLLTLSITIAALAFSTFILSTSSDTPLSMKYWYNGDNHWLILVLISMLLMVICAMTPLPAEAVTIANGAMFGPLLGSLITWLSAMIGAGITFLYGRYLLKIKDFRVLECTEHRRIDRWVSRWGNLGFAVARLVPVVPFFALNIGAAFLPISTRNYFSITGIFIIPHILVICFFGGHIAGL